MMHMPFMILMKMRHLLAKHHQKQNKDSFLVLFLVINNMFRYITLIFLIWASTFGSIFAAIEYTKPTKEEVDIATKACMETGRSQNEEKYSCPEWVFQSTNDRILSQQVIGCSIKMSLTFASIDEAAKKWLIELQKQRNPDFTVWSDNIKAMVTAPGWIRDTYISVCRTTTWTRPDNAWEVACAKTTDFLPETTCEKIALQKAEAWKNAGYILASKGIAKNAQNQKDEFIDRKKTKYSELIDKWNAYKRIVANAVSKFTNYTKSPVK